MPNGFIRAFLINFFIALRSSIPADLMLNDKSPPVSGKPNPRNAYGFHSYNAQRCVISGAGERFLFGFRQCAKLVQ